MSSTVLCLAAAASDRAT